ncbi:MAG: MFS transporter [Clostridiales bacterium]|nr:MFS transporter [Clostridiales bacterium]
MKQSNFWNRPLTRSAVRSEEVRTPEMLLGYLIGPCGAMLSSGIFTAFLNKYFTDVLQLDTSFLSALQLVSTILIVAANLIVGQLIERTHCLAGKARPWILLSALTVSVSSVLMFVVPFQSDMGKMVWIAVAYNLYYAVAYPIYSTANSTLVSVSTRDSQKRGALASFVNIAGLAVMGVGSMIFPILVSNVLHENQHTWFLTMLAIGCFSALTVLLQFKFTRERVTEESLGREEGQRQSAAPLRQQLSAVAGEKWWWVIMVFFVVFQLSGALKNGSMSYFCQWVVDSSVFGGDYGVAQSLLSVMGAIPMAVAAVAVVPLSNRFGKGRVVFVGQIVGAAGGIFAGLFSTNLVAVCIGVAVKCLGSSPACYLILAMLADVIDHIEYKCGIRTDGLTMSLYSSVAVAATPVCNAFFMAILGWAGYDQSGAAAAQSGAVQSAITVSYIWVESIAYILCAVLILFFAVERNLPAEQAAIQARRTEEGQQN